MSSRGGRTGAEPSQAAIDSESDLPNTAAVLIGSARSFLSWQLRRTCVDLTPHSTNPIYRNKTSNGKLGEDTRVDPTYLALGVQSVSVPLLVPFSTNTLTGMG
jgi:hypothetical protein